MGLNEENYSNIRRQIFAIKPLLDKIFNLVHQEEKLKTPYDG